MLGEFSSKPLGFVQPVEHLETLNGRPFAAIIIGYPDVQRVTNNRWFQQDRRKPKAFENLHQEGSVQETTSIVGLKGKDKSEEHGGFAQAPIKCATKLAVALRQIFGSAFSSPPAHRLPRHRHADLHMKWRCCTYPRRFTHVVAERSIEWQRDRVA